MKPPANRSGRHPDRAALKRGERSITAQEEQEMREHIAENERVKRLHGDYAPDDPRSKG